MLFCSVVILHSGLLDNCCFQQEVDILYFALRKTPSQRQSWQPGLQEKIIKNDYELDQVQLKLRVYLIFETRMNIQFCFTDMLQNTRMNKNQSLSVSITDCMVFCCCSGKLCGSLMILMWYSASSKKALEAIWSSLSWKLKHQLVDPLSLQVTVITVCR